MVPEPNDSKPLALEPFRACLILLDLLCMLPPIHLQNQPAFEADEIRDESSKRNLAAELEATHLSAAQFLPDESLGVSHVLAEFASTFAGHKSVSVLGCPRKPWQLVVVPTPHPNPPPQGGREFLSPSPLAGEGRGGG